MARLRFNASVSGVPNQSDYGGCGAPDLLCWDDDL